MPRRKRHEEHDNHEAWAIPYGDLVTLLLAFFVVMYAMSTVNEGKYRVLSDSLSEAFNGAPHAPRAVSDADGTGTRVELPRSQVRRLISAELPGLPVSSAEAATANATSAAPATKASATAAAAAAGPDTAGNAELSRVADEVTNAMGALVAAGEVKVRRYQNSVAVDISSDILFSSGVARLAPAAVPALQHLADALKPFTNAIRVEGHTDDVPIRTAEFQ